VTMPKITIYQKPTCTTCRQVYNALKESGVDFEAVDYQLCRYITRPAIANERLKRNRAGQVVLQLESLQRRHRSYRHGAAGVHGTPRALVTRPCLPGLNFQSQLCAILVGTIPHSLFIELPNQARCFNFFD
jgi:glutaredoxin/putative transposase